MSNKKKMMRESKYLDTCNKKMSSEISLQEYQEFVSEVTSPVSDSTDALIDHLDNLQNQQSDVNIALLLTSALGLSAESGEFTEIVKKIVFQGKPLSAENRFHMKRELGDVLWYWINACRSLDVDPYSVIQENISKLQKRFPDKMFSIDSSENRASNDL